MSCKHPLKAFPIGTHPSGKTKYYITSYEVDHVEKHKGKFVPCFSSFKSPYSTLVIKEFIEIPCGRCTACRLNYSRQWADRLMLELQSHEHAWFVTLTYDDEHLPKNLNSEKCKEIENAISLYNSNEYTKNELLEAFAKGISSPLMKRDVQLFIKRLRKRCPNSNIRYFCAGEYGSEKGRPHYHLIIFGLELNDLIPYKKSFNGDMYYNSPFLYSVWQEQGFVVVGKVTWESCAYTARYIMKKQYGSMSEDFYKLLGVTPEFTLMSLKPAIGREYYELNKDDIYKFDYFNFSTDSGGRKMRAPRYYDKLFEIEFPETMAEIKEHRKKLAEASKEKKMAKTSLSYLDQLQVEEDVLNRKIKKLKRSVD